MKETKRKREDSGWRVKGEVGVCVTVSKPQEQQRKAVNGSSPCLNRLWTVLQSTANHKSSWRLLWVRALTRCLPPDQGDDAGRGERKRQKKKERGGKKQRNEWRCCLWGKGKSGTSRFWFGFFILVTLKAFVRGCKLDWMCVHCSICPSAFSHLPSTSHSPLSRWQYCTALMAFDGIAHGIKRRFEHCSSTWHEGLLKWPYFWDMKLLWKKTKQIFTLNTTSVPTAWIFFWHKMKKNVNRCEASYITCFFSLHLFAWSI